MSLIKSQLKTKGKQNFLKNQDLNFWVKNQFARSIRRESALGIKKMIEGGKVCEDCDINNCLHCWCVEDQHPLTNRYKGWYD